MDEGPSKIPEPPLEALSGQYFECSYCYELARTPDSKSWKYVFRAKTIALLKLTSFIECTFLRIFNRIYAHLNIAHNRTKPPRHVANGFNMKLMHIECIGHARSARSPFLPKRTL